MEASPMPKYRIMTASAACHLFLVTLFTLLVPFVAATASDGGTGVQMETADLETCIQEALTNNHRRPASRYALAVAEAQHQQALAGYWPQISAKGGYLHMDEALNFVMPDINISLPGGATLPVTIPGMGTVPMDTISIPSQELKLMDEDSYTASLSATLLLFDGGMRKGYREQTQGLIDMMKQEVRRTDLEIVDSVKRYYYGAMLAARLHQLGKETLARMEGTLSLTETMYKEGSGEVKKTDWLDNKVMVESMRALLADLEKNEMMAQSALANTMGLPWDSSIKPADKEMPFTPLGTHLDELVSTAYRFNPDWAKLEAGIQAAKGAVRTAKSGHFPKLAVTGKLYKWWNDYDGGLVTDENQDGWNAGVGVEIPLFQGFLTKGKVAETKAQMAKLKEMQFLLKEGIGLQIKDTFLGLNATEKSHQATLDAMNAAQQNRDLNTRAYRQGLVETEKVIRAQLMEALMTARHYKVRYDHIALQSHLNLVVGNELMKKMEQ